VISGKVTQKGYALAIQGLTAMDDKVIKAAATGLARALLMVVGIVQREYLQGPRPLRLGEITTRLRQSISSQVTISGQTIRGRIGTNVKYAAFHEFGFHGTEQVSAHARVSYGPKRLAAPDARLPKTPTLSFVKAYTRRIDYAGRPFIAPALARSLPMIITEVKKELATVK
jgi:phage gpG-like protein